MNKNIKKLTLITIITCMVAQPAHAENWFTAALSKAYNTVASLVKENKKCVAAMAVVAAIVGYWRYTKKNTQPKHKKIDFDTKPTLPFSQEVTEFCSEANKLVRKIEKVKPTVMKYTEITNYQHQIAKLIEHSLELSLNNQDSRISKTAAALKECTQELQNILDARDRIAGNNYE